MLIVLSNKIRNKGNTFLEPFSPTTGSEFYYNDEEDTLVADNNNYYEMNRLHSSMPAQNEPLTDWENLPVKHLTVSSDNRPITPLKNKMIFDNKNSTLDFEDGKNIKLEYDGNVTK